MASVNARRLAPWMFVVGSAMVAGPAVGQVEDDGEPVAPSLPSGDDPEGDGDTTRSIEEELAGKSSYAGIGFRKPAWMG